MLGNLNVKNAEIAGNILILEFYDKSIKTAQKAVDFVTRRKSRSKTPIIELNEKALKRSLNANMYMWELCGKLAKAYGDNHTKEEVYIDAIKHMGRYEDVSVKREAVKHWFNIWNQRGLGWYCEFIGDSDRRDWVDIRAYYGSSVYDSLEMWRLTNYIIDRCLEEGVETKTKEEIESLCRAWGNRK